VSSLAEPRSMGGAVAAPPPRGLQRISQTQWIVISMIVGILLGYLFPDHPPGQSGFQASSLNFLSTIFLRMIKSLIVPLLFATLVVGIAGHGDDMKRVGKLAFRSILYFEVVTTFALVVGLLAVNIVKPGVGVNLASATAQAGTEFARKQTTFIGVVEHTVPQSFFEAASANEVLQIVFFAIIFAVALSQVQGPAKTFMLTACAIDDSRGAAPSPSTPSSRTSSASASAPARVARCASQPFPAPRSSTRSAPVA